MRLDDLLGNRQTQAGMLAEIGLRAFGIEPFEHLGQRLFGDAGTGVFDHDQNPILTPPRPDPDRIAGIAKGNRIGHKVDENLRQPGLKPVNADRIAGQINDEIDALVARLFRQILAKVRQRLDQVEFFFLFLHQLAVQARGVGNVADQTVQTANVMFDHIQKLVALFVLFHEPQRPDG